jgi:hypothetical protein
VRDVLLPLLLLLCTQDIRHPALDHCECRLGLVPGHHVARIPHSDLQGQTDRQPGSLAHHAQGMMGNTTNKRQPTVCCHWRQQQNITGTGTPFDNTATPHTGHTPTKPAKHECVQLDAKGLASTTTPPPTLGQACGPHMNTPD